MNWISTSPTHPYSLVNATRQALQDYGWTLTGEYRYRIEKFRIRARQLEYFLEDGGIYATTYRKMLLSLPPEVLLGLVIHELANLNCLGELQALESEVQKLLPEAGEASPHDSLLRLDTAGLWLWLWTHFQIDQTNAAIRVSQLQHFNRLIVVDGNSYRMPDRLVFNNSEIKLPLRSDDRRLEPSEAFLSEIIFKPVYDAGFSIRRLLEKTPNLPLESQFSHLKPGMGHFRTINQIVENYPPCVQVRCFIHLLDTFSQLGEFFLLRDRLAQVSPSTEIKRPSAPHLNTAKLRLWLFLHFGIQTENEAIVTVNAEQGWLEIGGDRWAVPMEFYAFKPREM